MRHDMNETDAIVQLERGVMEPRRLIAAELVKHCSDVVFVLGHAFGFDLVLHHDPSHSRLLRLRSTYMKDDRAQQKNAAGSVRTPSETPGFTRCEPHNRRWAHDTDRSLRPSHLCRTCFG